MATTLHIRCGSDIRDTLQLAGIRGDFAAWGDPFCEGPAVAGLDDDEYRRRRVQFMARHWGVDPVEAHRRWGDDASTLASTPSYERVVLWFEHDLYDQCILVQLLAGAKRLGLDTSSWSLVCVDRVVGIRRFVGLGQLGPEQLARLLPDARPVTEADLHDAEAARAAFVAPTPEALQRQLTARSRGAFAFLPRAVRRHLQELPWVENGLGLTERLSLDCIAAGTNSAIAVFGTLTSERDPLPYLGDTMFWARLQALARGPQPAISLVGSFPDQSVALTPIGRALVRGEDDFVDRNGIDADSVHRFRGGLEQRPEHGVVWRWDDAHGRVVRSSR
ncbi:MAG: DUF1835 domain-containing protein [Myxococcales bacterium FL481]|nr:MAG: DUF1835 domain-containing protein [Myxococcales bacterium FL481]